MAGSRVSTRGNKFRVHLKSRLWIDRRLVILESHDFEDRRQGDVESEPDISSRQSDLTPTTEEALRKAFVTFLSEATTHLSSTSEQSATGNERARFGSSKRAELIALSSLLVAIAGFARDILEQVEGSDESERLQETLRRLEARLEDDSASNTLKSRKGRPTTWLRGPFSIFSIPPGRFQVHTINDDLAGVRSLRIYIGAEDFLTRPPEVEELYIATGSGRKTQYHRSSEHEWRLKTTTTDDKKGQRVVILRNIGQVPLHLCFFWERPFTHFYSGTTTDQLRPISSTMSLANPDEEVARLEG